MSISEFQVKISTRAESLSYMETAAVLIWYIDCTGIIGKISIVSYATENNYRVKYMLDSTGIGSGTVHNECDIFGSEEEALVECSKRNAEQQE